MKQYVTFDSILNISTLLFISDILKKGMVIYRIQAVTIQDFLEDREQWMFFLRCSCTMKEKMKEFFSKFEKYQLLKCQILVCNNKFLSWMYFSRKWIRRQAAGWDQVSVASVQLSPLCCGAPWRNEKLPKPLRLDCWLLDPTFALSIEA